MRVTNPFSVKYWSIGKIIFVIWVLVASFYSIYSLWSNVVQRSYNNGQLAGQQLLVTQMTNMLESNKCQPLQISGKQLIDVSCLKQPETTNNTPAPVVPDSSAE